MTDQSSLNLKPAGSEAKPNPDAQAGAGLAPATPITPVPDATPGKSDELTEANAKLTADLAKMQRDMDRMRSTYDRQQRDVSREADQRITDADRRVDDVLLSQLEGEDRLKYERDRAQQQVLDVSKTLEAERIRNEEMLQLGQYRQYFTSLGIDQEQVDYTNMETMGETAFPAISRYVEDLKSKINPTPAPDPNLDPNAVPNLLKKKPPEATPLMTQQGKVLSQGPRTIPALMTALSTQLGYPVSEGDIGKLIQRGVLDETIFDSLDPDLMY